MGHPIHKHMGGMKSAERYDAKEAYNKDLSSKARMHYLENDISDKKGTSRQASPLDAVGAHSMRPGDYASHLASASEHKAPSDKERKGRKHKSDKQPSNTPPKAGMSRYSEEKGSPASMDASYDDAPMEFNRGLKKAQRQGKLSGEFNTLVKNSSVSRKASPVNNINYGTGYIGDKSKISYNENHVPQREMAAGKKSPNSRKKYY